MNNAVAAFMAVYQKVASLGKPLALVACGIGVIQYITGNPHEGIKRIKQAGFGFLMMWMIPGFMNMIEDVGRSMM